MAGQLPLHKALKDTFGSKGTISYSDCDLAQLRKMSEAFAEIDEDFKNHCGGTKVHAWRKTNFFNAFGDLLNRKPETWSGFTSDEATKTFRDKPSILFKKDLSESHPELYEEVFDAGHMEETGDKLHGIVENAKNNAAKKRNRPPSADTGIFQPPQCRSKAVEGSSLTELTAGELKEFLLKDFGVRLVSAEEDIEAIKEKAIETEKTQVGFSERLDEFDTQLAEVSEKVDNIAGINFNTRREALKFIQAKKRHRTDVSLRRGKAVFKITTGEPKFLNFASPEEPSGFNVGTLEQIVKERFQMIPGTMQARVTRAGNRMASAKFRLMGFDARAARLATMMTNKRAKYGESITISYPDGESPDHSGYGTNGKT